MTYTDFLNRKLQESPDNGFEPNWVPDFLFDFQKSLVEWAVRKGRAAIFADCGLGKTPMQLVWAENVIKQTNGHVLIVTPLAVSHQTVKEADKFGIGAYRSSDGTRQGRITVTNYERLHHFDQSEFTGVVCDESSIIKNFDGKTKAIVTEFMRRLPYRLLCTATAAPNDYFELGTSSEALGYLGYTDMLGKFFKIQDGGQYLAWGRTKYRFREHAKKAFWRWVCSWARACRKPSHLGFDDADFKLPPLNLREEIVKSNKLRDGMLFSVPAITLQEQREERRNTITERCEYVAERVDHDQPAICWCHLNDEGDRLAEMIPDALQISGKDSDESKVEKFLAFGTGELRVLVIKPKIGAWGLNWQHCNRMTMFPSHSYEQFYQATRRCWRFGQKREVDVDIVTTEGEHAVLKNLQRKSDQASEMFTALVENMNEEMVIKRDESFNIKEKAPAWL